MSPKSPAERSREHRERMAQQGGRQISVHLTEEAAAALDVLIDRHGSVTAAVNQALAAIMKPKKRRKARRILLMD